MDAIRERFPTVKTPGRDDICYATQNRQTAVKELASRCDRVLVIGSPTSSNANRLVEVAEKEGTAARLIETKAGIDYEWLDGVTNVGVTAGASTPEALVQETIAALVEHGFSRIAQLETAEENVVFSLPRQLRDDQ